MASLRLARQVKGETEKRVDGVGLGVLKNQIQELHAKEVGVGNPSEERANS